MNHVVNESSPVLSVPKFLSAVALSAILALSLVACSTNSGDSADASCAATSAGSHSESITVSGKFGEEPTVKMPAKFEAATTERSILIAGKGEPAVDGMSVTTHYSMHNAATGEPIEVAVDSSWLEETFPISAELNVQLPGLYKALHCAKAGDRTVTVVPARELFAENGPLFGIGETDTVVFVMDVSKVEKTPQPEPIPQATAETLSLPTPGAWVDNVPTVDLSGDIPVVTIPETAAPSELQVKVIKEGDGALVMGLTGVSVTVDYQGTSWESGEIFDQSFGRAPATFPVSGVVQGFAAAMVDQKVGSIVLVTMPPEYAYGPAGSGHALSGQTLVFLIEIHDVK